MALSVVHFRMHHGKDSEQITFSGNGIKLLDLKKEIVDKKKITGTLDFDLKIVDEQNKEYVDDDEIVPKNASVVVRRVPAKSAKAGLMARINNRGAVPSNALVQQKAEIIMPMKIESEETAESKTEVNGIEAGDEDVFARLTGEDNIALKRTAPLSAQWGATVEMAANEGKGPRRPPSNYTCTRCGKSGHNAKYCPTLGDPSYDPEIRLLNIPKVSRKKVTSLDGIDTSNKKVIIDSRALPVRQHPIC